MADNEKKPGAATEQEGEQESLETEIDETRRNIPGQRPAVLDARH